MHHENDSGSGPRSTRGLIFAVVFFGVFTNLLTLTGPLYMLQVYDRVLGSASVETLVSLTLLMVFLYATMAVIDWGRGRIMWFLAAEWRRGAEARAFDADMAAHRANAPTVALEHVARVHATLVSPAVFAVLDLSWSPVFFGLLFVFHPLLGWLALGGALLLVFATGCAHLLTKRARCRAAKAEIRARGLLVQAGEAQPVPAAARHLGSQWQTWRDIAERHLWQASAAGLGAQALGRALRLMLQSAMLGLGAWLALQGALTPGAMIAGTILSGRALAPLDQLTANWAMLQHGRLSWQTLEATTKNGSSHRSTLPQPCPEPPLIMENLALRWPDAKMPALVGVNIELRAGEVLGVVGPAGAGKTSLACLLTGLLPPLAGRVLLGAAPLYRYDRGAEGFIGNLPQHPRLWPGTVAENIALFAPNADPGQISKAASLVGADDMIRSLPEGYDTVIGSGGRGLSAGQIQLISLARAFYGDPMLIVLDAPSTHLGGDAKLALKSAIEAAGGAGRMVILLTQQIAEAEGCDKLLLLSRGRPTAYGPAKDVLRKVPNHIAPAATPRRVVGR